jgi:UDP-N-acetylmuramoyl-L-alanyl-D-glutamate--2,6-diaminopimelate ligase
MGRAAELGADRVYLTSDNPRSEDPIRIIEDALAGFESREHVIVEPDRKSAIGRAIIDAGPDDVVLIAGKGHEKTQTIGADVLLFDDVSIAAHMLEADTP